MAVVRITPESPLWLAFAIHLGQHNMARYALSEDGSPQPGMYYLAAATGEHIVGNLCLRHQPITIPPADPEGEPAPLLSPAGEPFTELFVCTFAVDAEYRRQGHGRELQLEGLALARERGCYQVRSWSSLDKEANYALKMSLGFALHPAIQVISSGKQFRGAYFVARVDQAKSN